MNVGQRVRVKRMFPPGHIRTPGYLRGKTGVIERVVGPCENPEQRAYMVPPDMKQNLRVRFTMAEIWGPGAENPNDTLDAEIYDHWLEPADAP
ncbi:MAG: nitrile hydratase subunit beta [Rhodobacteraceae bacterium]|nr:nitrile hydratase subunit beta [Paracoccaceae bacterium]